MLTAVIVVHVLLCIALVVAILLHNPQGTGLSAEIGGGFGYQGRTVIEEYLDRVTIGLALAFLVTTIVLVIFLK